MACRIGQLSHALRTAYVPGISRAGNARCITRSVEARLVKKSEGVGAVWSQDAGSVSVGIVLPDTTRGKDIDLSVHPKRMKLTMNGQVALEGDFPGKVDPDSSFFAIEEKDNKRMCVITLEKKEMGHQSWDGFFAEDELDTSITHQVFMDVKLGEDATERLVFGLYGNVVPRTVENFRALCVGDQTSSESDKPLAFKGSMFHRIITGFMAQGGDFTNGDGTGGESIYGRTFNDEGFRLKHDVPGLLSMANAGPDTNGSQFFLTFVPCPHLDGNHVVFGKLLDGQQLLNKIETKAGSSSGEPAMPVLVEDCGELPVSTEQ